MLYRLVGTPMVEEHSESLMRLFVRDANGAPVAGAHVQVWAGPPPTGEPAYFNDDLAYRPTNPSGMLEYMAVAGVMPETRDYWMRVLADDGTPLSDPVQFHFPVGSSIWITVNVQAGNGAPLPPDGGLPPDTTVQWDPRLTTMHISIQPVTGLNAGQAYWKIIAALYQDEAAAGGNHNLYYTALDPRGIPVGGVPVMLDWNGRDANDIPNTVYTDSNGAANYGLYAGPVGWNPDAGPGPYTAWVGDPDLRGRNLTGIPGEKFVGAGLPMNRHVNYIVTWRQVVAGGPVIANSSITGTIANAPANTQVTLSSGAQTFSTNTDSSGNYVFAHLPAGTYALSVAGAGVVNSNLVLDGNNAVTFNYTIPVQPSTKPLTHYMLFGPPNVSATRTNLVLALDYVARFAPTVGFSALEAQSAQNVTIVGVNAVPGSAEQSLQNAGSTVRHIAGADSYAMEQLFANLVASGNPYPST